MASAKVIYLDFDGVLHPTSPVMDGLFSRAHLLEELFASLQESTRIVVSSSWRFTHTLKELQAKLPNTVAQYVIDTTGAPVIGKHARYQEIITHANKLEPDTEWRALDDSYWEFPAHCEQLIRCNPNTGIGKNEILVIQQWLKDKL